MDQTGSEEDRERPLRGLRNGVVGIGEIGGIEFWKLRLRRRVFELWLSRREGETIELWPHRDLIGMIWENRHEEERHRHRHGHDGGVGGVGAGRGEEDEKTKKK